MYQTDSVQAHSNSPFISIYIYIANESKDNKIAGSSSKDDDPATSKKTVCNSKIEIVHLSQKLKYLHMNTSISCMLHHMLCYHTEYLNTRLLVTL